MSRRKATEQRLLLLLSPRQKREWALFGRVTEIAPSGRPWRLYPSLSHGSVWPYRPEWLSVARVRLCVIPIFDQAQREWWNQLDGSDVVTALIAALRGGDEDSLIQMAIIGEMSKGRMTPEERAIRRERTSRMFVNGVRTP
jgi:hypothetical protein